VRQGNTRVCEIVVLSVGPGTAALVTNHRAKAPAFVTNLFERKAAVLGRATRWKFVTPARMFPRSALSLTSNVSAVILSSGTENLLTYKSLDASGGRAKDLPTRYRSWY
jgi:hypothetical protein